MLNIRVQEQSAVSVIAASGRIDSSTAGQLGQAFNAAIETGFYQLVLDLSSVDYMSSAGLREIVMVLKKVRATGGDLRLTQVPERVQEVLQLSGLDTIVQAYDTPADAIGSFA